MQKEISLLRDALFEASDCIKEMQQSLKVSSKKHIVDLVTEADLKSEEILMKAIKNHFPDDGIISEESEIIKSGTERSWIIDPLDGTVNYANNIPQVAITLMLLEDTKPTQAYVLDIYNDILYEGYRGSGAYKNGEKLSIKKDTTLQKSIIATGFPYDRVFNSKDYIKTFEAVLKSCGGIRRFGSAALDVCWIADNKFDGYFEFFIKPWDTLGASLILEEAGGAVIDEVEKFPSINSNLIIASNKSIHEDLKKLVLSNIETSLKKRL